MSPSTRGSALPERSRRSLGIVRASAGARVGAAILVVVGLCAAVPQLLAPIDPTEQRLLARFTPPLSRSADGTFAVLGTDQLGRDILSRLIFGARTSSLIGFAAVLIAGITGTVLGLLAGVRGGVWDHAVMRLADMQLAFPFILLAITVIGILGPSIRNLILVVGFANWAAYARVVRAETLAVRERPFVEAARSLGLTLPHLLGRHARGGAAVRRHALLARPLPGGGPLHDGDGHQPRRRHAPRRLRSLSPRATEPGPALAMQRHSREGGPR